MGGDGRAARRRPDRERSASRPGPANGFTLDVIDCFERFGDAHRLGDGHPQPDGAVARRARARRRRAPRRRRHRPRRRLRRAVLGRRASPATTFAERDHRLFRPQGWIEAGREKLERMRPVAERHGLTPLQLACAWNLAHGPVETRRADAHPGARRPRRSRPSAPSSPPTPRDVAAERRARSPSCARIGDNTRLDAAQGRDARPRRPARSPTAGRVDDQLAELAARWRIDPARDLTRAAS